MNKMAARPVPPRRVVYRASAWAAAEGRSRSVPRLAGVVRAMEAGAYPGTRRCSVSSAWRSTGLERARSVEAEHLTGEGAAMPMERIFEELAESPR